MFQKTEKELQEMGYKTQIKQLSDYHDDYGLESPDGDEDEQDDDDDDEMDSDGSEDDDDDEDDEDDESDGR